MDKERRSVNCDQGSDKSARVASSRAKWTPSSKFNKILSNIERSILNQFTHHSNGTNDGASDAKNSRHKHRCNKTTSATRHQSRPPQVERDDDNSSKLTAAQTASSGKRTDDQQPVMKGSHSHSQVTSTSNNTKIKLHSNEDTSGRAKMTVNKNQQRHVFAALQNINVANPRLSIPPPHANDEARNQRHKLLFDGTVALSGQSYDADTRVALPPTDQRTSKTNSRLDELGNKSDIIRSNCSPASSAKSLPTLSVNSAPRSQSIANDDEESGFATYQSRRSLFLNDTISNDIKGKHQDKGTSNMILLHSNNTPTGTRSYNHAAINQTRSQDRQNFQVNPNYTNQFRSVPTQITNTQQLLTSNQVPISSVEQVPNSNFFTSNNFANQQISLSHFNNRQNQFYGMLGPSGTLPHIFPSESDQQIYVNAPPKPRRYQFYDPTNHQSVHPGPVNPLSISSSSGPTNPVISVSHGDAKQFLHQQPMTIHRLGYNQALQRPPVPLHSSQQQYGIPYQPYQQQKAVANPDEPLESSRLLQPSGVNSQQRPINLPYTLTKSKSSLEACDLVKFKLDKFNGENRVMQQRYNTMSTNQPPQVPPPPAYLINCSRFNIMNQYPATIYPPQPATAQIAQNNLHRSRSVTHLSDFATRQDDQNIRILPINARSDPNTRYLQSSSLSTTNLEFIGQADNHYSFQQGQSVENPNRLLQHFTNPVQSRSSQLVQAPPVTHKPAETNWVNHSATPNCYTRFNTYQPHKNNLNNKANSAYVNNSKLVRQSYADNSAQKDHNFKSSLDDKIRCLMIGKDTVTSVDSSNRVTKDDSRNSHANSSSNATSIPPWKSNQHLVHDELLSNRFVALKHGGSPQSTNTSILEHKISDSSPNSIFMNDFQSATMGNKHQRQYQVNIEDNSSSPSSIRQRTSGEVRHKLESGANSHLIVDLTTPRVLTKTQTTLLSNGYPSEVQQMRDSWSMNQVGLPQPTTNQLSVFNNVRHSKPGDMSNKIDSKVEEISDDQSSKMSDRTAPYYYSDLKSEKQRQALLNIVQQKSLSPPPQLLSRSTDQSSTRLAPKSSTSGQAKLLGENVMHHQLRQAGSTKHVIANEFSSVMNISKNIDKLFDSPTQVDQRTSVAQSMFALNDATNPSRFSSSKNASESISSDYHSGDLKGRYTYCKSKSLENICQKSGCEIVASANKLSNPVYENIRCSDKLMNAINDSTTCFSSLRTAKKSSYSNGNNSDESMDSIIGSSLDESDSSLDFIDEIKISPTDNHLQDISQLIEQFRCNYTKLNEKYKSTLLRISKTKHRQIAGDTKSEKLARRLQLLESKSKKCEARSKNQLALIQMMEKVLKQSEVRVSNSALSNESLTSSTIGNLSAKLDNTRSDGRDRSRLSPLRAPANESVPAKLAQGKEPIVSGRREEAVYPVLLESRSKESLRPIYSHNVIKATVTETENTPIISEVIDNSKSIHEKDSRLYRGDKELSSTFSKEQARAVAKSTTNVEKWNKSGDESHSNPEIDEDESSSGSSIEKEIVRSSHDITSSRNQDGSESNDSQFMRDDDDFIEFLATDGSSQRSQFEASQFSVSDFNTSTSTSDSSNSGTGNDSLSCSSITSHSTKHRYKNVDLKPGASILKYARRDKNGAKGVTNGTTDSCNRQNSSDENGKFNSVLGNVIDVDVCPMNGLSQSSPVDNRASC